MLDGGTGRSSVPRLYRSAISAHEHTVEVAEADRSPGRLIWASRPGATPGCASAGTGYGQDSLHFGDHAVRGEVLEERPRRDDLLGQPDAWLRDLPIDDRARNRSCAQRGNVRLAVPGQTGAR